MITASCWGKVKMDMGDLDHQHFFIQVLFIRRGRGWRPFDRASGGL